MRDDKASFTARIVAVARALGWRKQDGVTAALDPTAAVLLDMPTLRNVPTWQVLARNPIAARLVSLATLGVFDHVVLRTHRIDDALIAGCNDGIEQVVILGAGLDGRAWRVAELSACTVYEVDHPATQRLKKERVASLPKHAADIRFVSVDFERDSLAERLVTEGYDVNAPTAWIWEGVTMYLEPKTVSFTLGELARLSPEKSKLIVTYATRSRVFEWGLTGAILGAFSVIGEPLAGLTSKHEFQANAQRAGWHPTDDTGAAEHQARYPGFARAPFEERVLTCERVER